MPPLGTPSPFRHPPRPGSSARPNAGRQFASTPRFLLSQRPTEPEIRRKYGVDSLDVEDSPQSTPLPAARTVPQLRRRETIEDPPEDEQYEAISGPRDRSTDAILDSETDQSTPPEGAGDIDAAFEALFGPTSTHRRKRRRISLDRDTGPTLSQHGKCSTDTILTSSPEAPSQIAGHPSSPIPFRTPKQTAQTASSRKTLTATDRTPGPATPASTRPHRNHPRFMMSQPASSSQPQFTPRNPAVSTTQLPTPAPQRQKPAFVLPRSPSPSRMDDGSMDSPTPFSPSSSALRRRGRPRSSAPGYLPGGMASEVRSWILEMGTKREQMQFGGDHRTRVPQPSQSRAHQEKYFVVIRISHVRQSSLRSSGPLAYIQGTTVTSGDPTSQTIKVLLLGPPRSPHSGIQTPALQPGHLIGVCRGLVWEVDLEERVCPTMPDSENQESKELERERAGVGLQKEGKWLVGMEWELIHDS